MRRGPRHLGAFRDMACNVLQRHELLLVAVQHAVVQLFQRQRAVILEKAMLLHEGRCRLARLQRHGVDAEARINRFELRLQHAQHVPGVMGRHRKARGKVGARAIDAEQLEDQPQGTLAGLFEIAAELVDQSLKNDFQPFGMNDRLHQRAMRHEGGGRVQRVQRLVPHPHHLVETDQHILADSLATEAAGQRGARNGEQRSYRLEAEPPQRLCSGAVDAQGLDGQRLDVLCLVAGKRPCRTQRGTLPDPDAEAILRQPLAHLCHHALFAAEEVGNAGHVQQDAVGCIGRHPGAVTLHPAAQAEQAVHVVLRLMRLGQELRQLRARVRQPHAAHQPEAARRGIDRDEAQAGLAAFNQCEGQALGGRFPARLDPCPDESLDGKLR